MDWATHVFTEPPPGRLEWWNNVFDPAVMPVEDLRDEISHKVWLLPRRSPTAQNEGLINRIRSSSRSSAGAPSRHTRRAAKAPRR
jgi:hypothetical protein